MCSVLSTSKLKQFTFFHLKMRLMPLKIPYGPGYVVQLSCLKLVSLYQTGTHYPWLRNWNLERYLYPGSKERTRTYFYHKYKHMHLCLDHFLWRCCPEKSFYSRKQEETRNLLFTPYCLFGSYSKI